MKNKELPPMARLVRDRRARLGLNQHELAKRSGVARVTIANVELGKHQGIRPATAFKLAKALGIRPEQLTGNTSTDGRASMMGPGQSLVDSFAQLKRGTAVEPSPLEREWLERQLAAWQDDTKPSIASLLFLLLAYRHAEK